MSGTIVPGDRGRRGQGYMLLTPANRCVSRLPSLPGARLYKFVTPRMAGARFGEYLVESETGIDAALEPAHEHFLYGLSGDARAVIGGTRHTLSPSWYAYIPPAARCSIEAEAGAKVSFLWIKRRYETWRGGESPRATFGQLHALVAERTAVNGLLRRELLDPADPAFDFNVSHLEFEPGVALNQIEIRDEEHGLYMTSGGGLWRLNGDELPVQADDFIYTAPYCPQGFRAGPDGGSYLLYRDAYRDGF